MWSTEHFLNFILRFRQGILWFIMDPFSFCSFLNMHLSIRFSHMTSFVIISSSILDELFKIWNVQNHTSFLTNQRFKPDYFYLFLRCVKLPIVRKEKIAFLNSFKSSWSKLKKLLSRISIFFFRRSNGYCSLEKNVFMIWNTSFFMSRMIKETIKQFLEKILHSLHLFLLSSLPL